MKTIRTAALSLFAFTAAFFWQASADAQLKIDCKSVSERVRTAIEAKPDQVLTIVEDALVAYSGCVDAIVKTAIETTEADAAGVKQIVLVAVTTAEKDAPQIAESAVAAAPDHADAVREAFAEAFENKTDTSKTAVVAAKPAVEKSSEIGGESVKLAGHPKELKTQVSLETSREALTSSAPADTSEGKAVIGEVDYGGKEVVYDSGKGVVENGGKSVLFDNGVNYLAEGGEGVVGSGPNGGTGGNGLGQNSRNNSFSYGSVDLAGVYMVPPIATASPVEEETKVIFKSRSRTKAKNRRVIRSNPMSPTSP